MGETDHSSYVILYYQKGRSISVKLYGGLAPGDLGQADEGWQRGGKSVMGFGYAPEDPNTGMGAGPYGAQSLESFVPRCCRRGARKWLLQAGSALGLELCCGGHRELWGRDRRADSISPALHRTDQPGQRHCRREVRAALPGRGAERGHDLLLPHVRWVAQSLQQGHPQPGLHPGAGVWPSSTGRGRNTTRDSVAGKDQRVLISSQLKMGQGVPGGRGSSSTLHCISNSGASRSGPAIVPLYLGTGEAAP